MSSAAPYQPLKNAKRLSKFYSTEGQKFGIAKDRGIAYKIISENLIPASIANWLGEKGIPWEVISAGGKDCRGQVCGCRFHLQRED
jgi:hypothetical protein